MFLLHEDTPPLDVNTGVSTDGEADLRIFFMMYCKPPDMSHYEIGDAARQRISPPGKG